MFCGNENIFTLEFSLGYLVRQTATIIWCVRMTLPSIARVQLRNKRKNNSRQARRYTDSHAYCSFCLLVVVNESRVDSTVSKLQGVPNGPLGVLRILELCASKDGGLVSAPAAERGRPARLHEVCIPCRFPVQPTASARHQGAPRSHGSRQSLAWRTARRGRQLLLSCSPQPRRSPRRSPHLPRSRGVLPSRASSALLHQAFRDSKQYVQTNDNEPRARLPVSH